jgi:transcriptional regulator with GAF, ATPase, and Fis domain
MDAQDPIRVWYHSWGRQAATDAPAIVETLERAGISAYPIDQASPLGSGILIFDEIAPETCELLHDVSCNGLRRVLAVATVHSAAFIDSAWRLLSAGASDALVWDARGHAAAQVVARFKRWEAIDRLVRSPLIENNLVGGSPAWVTVVRRIVEVAVYTDATLLITGESGTGKELIARLVHTLDPRAGKRDFVVLDCTTIVPELSGSEFFGHERGAFTGAVTARDGAFALAHGGTLFLDEVAELPLTLQAQLLRVVQEQTYKRVGGNTWQRTDFRLVCATNKDLLEEVGHGRFRRDLYYRIAAVTCRLPPLRDRPEDILPLVRHFLRELRPGESPPELDVPVRNYVQRRAYPGNVRDLKQMVARMTCYHVGSGYVTVGDIPEEERPTDEGAPSDWRAGAFEHAIRRALLQGFGLKDISRAAADCAIRIAVDDAGGSLPRAARNLGVTDRALQIRFAERRRNGGDTDQRT